MNTSAALVPAAGQGLRLGEGPKALLKLNESTLIEIVVHKLSAIVDEIIVAAPPGQENLICDVLPSNVKVITGGATRWDTVNNLIQASRATTVLLQNVANPFASSDLLKRVLSAAKHSGAAGAFMSSSVPTGIAEGGVIKTFLPRETSLFFQTPQAFSLELLKRFHDVSERYQSTAQYFIAKGHPVTLIPGERENIKITDEFDWEVARTVIEPRLRQELEIAKLADTLI